MEYTETRHIHIFHRNFSIFAIFSCGLPRRNFSLVARYSLKFTCWSLLVAKFARYSLWKLLVSKNHSLLHCKFLILILRKKQDKITHYEKIFSYIKQKFSHFEKGLGINDIFFVSLRLPLFSPRCITLKRNQKIIWKISNYLT